MGMNELKLCQKMYDLVLYSFPIIDRFPKKQKFVLGQQLQNCMIGIIKLIIHANKTRNRRPKLFEIDIELEKLRLLVRLAKDLGFMSIKKYGNHAEKINEIGKILGGWMKAT